MVPRSDCLGAGHTAPAQDTDEGLPPCSSPIITVMVPGTHATDTPPLAQPASAPRSSATDRENPETLPDSAAAVTVFTAVDQGEDTFEETVRLLAGLQEVATAEDVANGTCADQPSRDPTPEPPTEMVAAQEAERWGASAALRERELQVLLEQQTSVNDQMQNQIEERGMLIEEFRRRHDEDQGRIDKLAADMAKMHARCYGTITVSYSRRSILFDRRRHYG